MKKFISIIILIGLLGCAPTVHYPKGKTSEDFNLDKKNCENEAFYSVGQKLEGSSGELLWSRHYLNLYINCMFKLGYK